LNVATIVSDVSHVAHDVATVVSDVSHVAHDVATVVSDVSHVAHDVATVVSDVTHIAKDVASADGVATSVGGLETKRNDNLVTSQHTPIVFNDQKIYAGYDIHAYTRQVNEVASKYQSQFSGELSVEEFETILNELQTTYGSKVTYTNLRNTFRNGAILDPDVPNINVAILLKTVWKVVKESDVSNTETSSSSSLKSHFNQTLDDIGMTCIQGISHRLFIDFIAFCTE